MTNRELARRNESGKPTRWQGLAALVGDAVEHGAGAIERVHVATARRPFRILAQIPVVAGPAAVVQAVHDASVAITYDVVRGVTRVVRGSLVVAIDAAEGS